jgi:hypothetical protein
MVNANTLDINEFRRQNLVQLLQFPCGFSRVSEAGPLEKTKASCAMIAPVRPAALPTLRSAPGTAGRAATVGERIEIAARPAPSVSAAGFRGASLFDAQRFGQAHEAARRSDAAAASYRLQDAVDAPVRRLLTV